MDDAWGTPIGYLSLSSIPSAFQLKLDKHFCSSIYLSWKSLCCHVASIKAKHLTLALVSKCCKPTNVALSWLPRLCRRRWRPRGHATTVGSKQTQTGNQIEAADTWTNRRLHFLPDCWVTQSGNADRPVLSMSRVFWVSLTTSPRASYPCVPVRL